MERGIKIFFCYAHEDRDFLDQLMLHLLPLQREGIITVWSDADISPGTNWQEEISKHLLSSQVILLLVSTDFIASEYVYSIEMRKALELHKLGKARVIPIIVRPTLWEATPIRILQALPRDGQPIVSAGWHSLDEAFLNVVQGIRLVCEELLSSSKSTDGVNSSSRQTIETNHLNDVFMKSGFPHITFVEREDFELLKLSLTQSGRGIVIGGPSGVGKTTALKKAIDEVKSEGTVRKRSSKINGTFSMLSARDPDDRDKLGSLSKWHQGTVVIDDFHRLDAPLREKIADYLKYLADVEPDSKKLVIVGIPQSGQTLVDISFDIATRIDVFKWGKVKDELIIQMIEKGERGLNIEFDRKVEIAFAANGSLNVAQYICFHICHRPLIGMVSSERERTLVKLAQIISKELADKD